MIVPVGERYQQVLYLMTKEKGQLKPAVLRPTLFVPMTGKAEQQRQVKPDSKNPRLYNSGFEELAGDSREPIAWYYQRQMQVIDTDKAPEGKNFIRFTNDTPGRQSRMLQGLGIDGRFVKKVELSCRVRTKDVRIGTEKDHLPAVMLTFFDENRSQLGYVWLGHYRGTQDWQSDAKVFDVPPLAREAIVHIGLFGATGEVDFDQVDLKMPSGK